MNPVKCLLAIWLGLAAGLATKEIGESVFCRICQSAQNSLLGFSEKHLQFGLQLASLVCQTESTKDLCDYFVDNFGASIFHSKVKFLQTTQHLCANVLKLCQETYQPFDVEAFRRKINAQFPVPVNLLGSNRQNRKKSAAKSFKALVLNDIHIQNDYSHGAPTDCGQPGGCCSNRFQPKPGSDRRAGYWGTADAACDAPDYLFFKTIEFIKNSTDKPDFIFMLGDNTGHNFFELEPQILVDSTKIIIDTLKQTFPDIPTIPVLGNHECHHVDYFDFADQSNFVIQNIYPLFEAFVPKPKIDDLIADGFFSQEYPEFNLKVITLNSQINDSFNTATLANSIFFEQFLLKLAAEIHASESQGQRVIILGHIPLTDYYSVEEINKSLIVILERFKDTVITLLSAHTHNDQLRFIRDKTGKPFNINFISPSVTPFSSYNPSFRIYEFENGDFKDFVQYALDLDKHNEMADQGNFDFSYDVKYRFMEEYDLPAWNTETIQAFYDRLMSRDPAIVARYARNYYCTDRIGDGVRNIEATICEISDDLGEIITCMEEYVPGIESVRPIMLFRDLFVSKVLVPIGKQI